MGIFALRIPVGIAALVLASGTSAQINPKLLYTLERSSTVVPLYNRAGDVVLYIAYGGGTDGMREVRFVDATGRLINILRDAPPAVAGGVPVVRDRYPPGTSVDVRDHRYESSGGVTVRDHRRSSGSSSPSSGVDDGKSDKASEARALADWIRNLEDRVASLERSRR